MLVRDGAECARLPLPGSEGCPTLAVVEQVAFVLLVARRAGCSVVLQGVGPRVLELLDLAGLLTLTSVEVARQAEELEEPGVEEVVVPDDPVT